MDALLKLCSPNSKVLLKDNEKKPQFEPTENIRVNEKFQSNHMRVNLVPQVSMNKIQQGGGKAAGIDDLDKEVAKDRQHVIDAVTVRIMKMRKTEKANDLLAEIIRQIKIFQAQPVMIKQRIESLIEKEYLERDPKDRTMLIYKP